MIARDLMRTTAPTVRENAPLAEVYDLFVEETSTGLRSSTTRGGSSAS